MADLFSKKKRSAIMSAVKGKNTAPEKAVAVLLKGLGVRYKRHLRALPGSPDFVLPESRTVLFIHGCFWHGHPHCARAHLPATNQEFWRMKIAKNIQRDKRQKRSLQRAGWKTVTLWSCKKIDRLILQRTLGRIGVKMGLAKAVSKKGPLPGARPAAQR